jgi:hypothetical protein
MTFHLNTFQITALETYSNGEFSYLASVPSPDFETSLVRCGDILLQFILYKLSATEGCHTRSDAILRLAKAAEEIDAIIDTLHDARHDARHDTSPQPSDGEKTRQRET